MMTNGGDCEDAPPDTVQECPLSILELRVPLHKEDQRSEGEDCHPHQHHHQTQLLVGLVTGTSKYIKLGQPSTCCKV